MLISGTFGVARPDMNRPEASVDDPSPISGERPVVNRNSAWLGCGRIRFLLLLPALSADWRELETAVRPPAPYTTIACKPEAVSL
jgi:hypothetical protein